MASPAVSTGARNTAEALHELDDLLEELSRLGAATESASVYHAGWIARAVLALGAPAGAVWVRAAEARWHTDATVDQTGEQQFDRLAAQRSHGELLAEVAATGHARIVAPGASSASGTSNPTTFLVLLLPLGGEGPATAVAEVLQRPGASPATQEGYLRLLEAFGEMAGEFHRRYQVRAWKALAETAAGRERFIEGLHASLDPLVVAATAANDGRSLVACDRVSVLAGFRGREGLLAVSGVDQIDFRSEFARLTTEIGRAAIKLGDPIWHGVEQSSATEGPLAGPLDAWVESTQARVAAIVPLAADRNAAAKNAAGPCGVMTFEWFGGQDVDDALREQVGWVARQTAQAMNSALEHRAIPLFSLWQWLGRTARALRLARLRVALWLSAVAATFAALAFVPAEFTVSGQGKLQPEVRREVFAGTDGQVAELYVDHGASCRAGDVLVRLTRPQLDFEFARVAGELQTAVTRQAVVQAALLDANPQSAADRERYQQLSGEQEELKEQLASLEAQQAILRRQQAELEVRSPIDGSVITWNVRELLESRPVQRGQALLTVAQVDGPWILEIEVPDDKAGHVLAAQQALGPNLDVEFLLATDPATTYRGNIEKVALATDVGVSGPATVLVTVRFDRDQIAQLRPGATVVPSIRCGRQPLGYVWFHGVWEAVQKHVLF